MSIKLIFISYYHCGACNNNRRAIWFTVAMDMSKWWALWHTFDFQIIYIQYTCSHTTHNLFPLCSQHTLLWYSHSNIYMLTLHSLYLHYSHNLPNLNSHYSGITVFKIRALLTGPPIQSTSDEKHGSNWPSSADSSCQRDVH